MAGQAEQKAADQKPVDWRLDAPPREGSDSEPVWARRASRQAILLLLFPYLLAFVVNGVAQRISRAGDAQTDIERVRVELARRVNNDPADMAKLRAAVDALVSETHADATTPAAKRFRALAMTVAWEWRAPYVDLLGQSGRGPAEIVPEKERSRLAILAWSTADARMREALRWEWIDSLVVQAFFVFFLPGLGILSFLRARREIIAENKTAAVGFSSFTRAINHRRNRHLLANKTRMFFWRRFSLGALLTLGTTYMFTPLGQLTSTLTSYGSSRPVPGETSLPIWSYHFSDAPIMLTGFVGFLLYLFTSSLHRSVTRNLNDRFTMSLFARGMVVSLLGLVLSSITTGDDAARALVFLVGVFPQRGVEWLAKKASITADSLGGVARFESLVALDEDKQSTLRELGIDSVHDLARCDLEHVLDEVGIDANVLVRATDRALLVDTFGVDGAKKLESLPVFTASELVIYVKIPPKELEERRSTLTAEERRPEKFDPTKLPRRDPAEVQTRLAEVKDALGVKNVEVQIAALEGDDNVLYILHQKLVYAQR